MSRNKQLAIIIALPAVSSIIIHIFAFAYWLDSPFPFYNSIKGLDMQTIINFGKGFYNGNAYFSIPNAIIASNYYLNEGAFSVVAHILLHYTLGVLITVLVILTAKLHFRNNLIALLSGLFASAYAPAIIYESFVLKESLYTFFCFLSFFCIIIQKHNKNNIISFISGSCFILPLFVRDSSIIWIFLALLYLLTPQKHCFSAFMDKLKANKLFLIGISVIVLLVFSINLYNCHAILPLSIFNKSYNFKVGSIPAPSSMNIPVENPISPESADSTLLEQGFALFNIYFNKILLSLKACEVTNNINYYFVSHHFSPVKFLIQPILLIPLALTGLLLFCRKKRIFKHQLPLFLYLLSFLIPMWVFLPLSRYKITLYPIFCISAAYFLFFTLIKLKNQKAKATIYAILLLSLVLYLCIPQSTPLRGSDFFVHGQAVKSKEKKYSQAVGACYFNAYKLSPNATHLTAFINYLFANKDFHSAQKLLHPFYKQNPYHFDLALKLAITYLVTGQPGTAEKILMSLSPNTTKANPSLYFYNLGEAARLQQKKGAAINYYKKSLKTTDDEKLGRVLEQRIKELSN